MSGEQGEALTGAGWSGPLRAVETHLSWLVLVEDRVLKAKKPVWTEFCDLTSRDARVRVTEDEVRLNRRLAPDVYLGVARLSGVTGLDEPVVVMRRMPEDRRLSTLVEQGIDVTAQLRELAHQLADFHAAVDPAPQVADIGSTARLWRDNTAELLAHGEGIVPREQVERIEEQAGRFLRGRESLWEQRAEAGRFRDGHGDLLADDVFCLPEGPRVLDCLEFDARLRAGDVLADTAFLAMDLERLGRADLGELLLTEHRSLTGDDWPRSLADHWIGYRAQVRAKVACWRATQGSEQAGERARTLLDLSEQRLVQAQVQLVVIGGAPGTGKTTLSTALGARTGWQVLRSDVVRKQLFACAPEEHRGESLDTGMYSPEASAKVLEEMVDLAGRELRRGISVVLDASFGSELWRRAALRLAADTSSTLSCVRTVVGDDVADQRLRRRAAAGLDASDATVDEAPALRERFSPWPEATELATVGEVDGLVDAVLSSVGR